MPLADFFDDTKYQLMHIEMFPYGIIHAECLGGEIDLLLNRRVQVGFFPWRFVDGESCIGRCVAILSDEQYAEAMQQKETMPRTRFGDAFDPLHAGNINRLTAENMK
jgi:hypothetical protein